MVIYIYVIGGTTEFRYSRDGFCNADYMNDHDINYLLLIPMHMIILYTNAFEKFEKLRQGEREREREGGRGRFTCVVYHT